MTTIVYHKGVLAADRRMTSGNTVVATMKKIRKLDDESCVAFAGNPIYAPYIINWINGDGERPKAVQDDSYACLHVDPAKGLARYIESDYFDWDDVTCEPYVARGTGGLFAMGALAHGATAIEAVLIASQFDINSGDGVDFIEVG